MIETAHLDTVGADATFPLEGPARQTNICGTFLNSLVLFKKNKACFTSNVRRHFSAADNGSRKKMGCSGSSEIWKLL